MQLSSRSHRSTPYIFRPRRQCVFVLTLQLCNVNNYILNMFCLFIQISYSYYLATIATHLGLCRRPEVSCFHCRPPDQPCLCLLLCTPCQPSLQPENTLRTFGEPHKAKQRPSRQPPTYNCPHK